MFKYLSVLLLVLLLATCSFAQKQSLSPTVSLSFEIYIDLNERSETKPIGKNVENACGMLIAASEYFQEGSGSNHEDEHIDLSTDVVGQRFPVATLWESQRRGNISSVSMTFNNKTVYSTNTATLSHNSDSNENEFYFTGASGSFMITGGTVFTPVND